MTTSNITSWPSFSDQEAEAAHAVIASNKVNYWTGQVGRKFEAEYAQWIGTSKAIALANGTLALDLALKSLGIGAGDEVIVPEPMYVTYVGFLGACGVTTVPVALDANDNFNINVDNIAAAITSKTKAILINSPHNPTGTIIEL